MNTKSREWSLCVGWQTGRATQSDHSRKASGVWEGGTLALMGHDRDNLERGVGGPLDPTVLHTVEELVAAASGLDIIECAQVERVTAEGTAIDTVFIARAN